VVLLVNIYNFIFTSKTAEKFFFNVCVHAGIFFKRVFNAY